MNPEEIKKALEELEKDVFITLYELSRDPNVKEQFAEALKLFAGKLDKCADNPELLQRFVTYYNGGRR